MISSLINLTIASLVTTQYIKYKNSINNSLKDKWEESLKLCNIQNIKNKNGDTFRIAKCYKKSYGYDCVIPFVPGLTFEDLERTKSLLEDNLKTSIEFENTNKYFVCKILESQEESEFKLVKTSYDQLLGGYCESGNPYLVDMNLNPHLLIAGKSGTGKSVYVAQMITNLLCNNSKELELYLGQIRKGDNDIFKNCKGVVFNATSLEEISIMLERIDKKAIEREKLFSYLGVKNINQYNSRVKKAKNKMKRIYILIDELSFFMPTKNEDDGDNLYYKEKCWEYILNIVKAGRSAGIHFISITQRSTAANLDPNVKSQLTRITFKQGSKRDSENVINTPDAFNLEFRECIMDGSDYIKLKVPEVDKDMLDLKEFLPELNILDLDKDVDSLVDEYKKSKIEINKNEMIQVSKVHINSGDFIDKDKKQYKCDNNTANSKEKYNIINLNDEIAASKPLGMRKSRRKKINE